MNLLLFLVHTVHELMSSQLQSFWIEYLSEKITNTNRTPKWYRILDWTWSSVKDQPQPVRSQTIISCRGVIYATLYDLLINPSKCFSKGCSSLKKKRGGVYDVGFKIWNTKIVEALALSTWLLLLKFTRMISTMRLFLWSATWQSMVQRMM